MTRKADEAFQARVRELIALGAPPKVAHEIAAVELEGGDVVKVKA